MKKIYVCIIVLLSLFCSNSYGKDQNSCVRAMEEITDYWKSKTSWKKYYQFYRDTSFVPHESLRPVAGVFGAISPMSLTSKAINAYRIDHLTAITKVASGHASEEDMLRVVKIINDRTELNISFNEINSVSREIQKMADDNSLCGWISNNEKLKLEDQLKYISVLIGERLSN